MAVVQPHMGQRHEKDEEKFEHVYVFEARAMPPRRLPLGSCMSSSDATPRHALRVVPCSLDHSPCVCLLKHISLFCFLPALVVASRCVRGRPAGCCGLGLRVCCRLLVFSGIFLLLIRSSTAAVVRLCNCQWCGYATVFFVR
jgi:hypothetical protein